MTTQRSASRVTDQGGTRVRVICYDSWGYIQAPWGEVGHGGGEIHSYGAGSPALKPSG